MLFLNGNLHSTFEAIALEDIGENEKALFCFTSMLECCGSDQTGGEGLGRWVFPDGSRVPSAHARNLPFVTREPSAVLLHRPSNVILPTGVYTCEIPDVVHENATKLYVHLYRGPNIPGKTWCMNH